MDRHLPTIAELEAELESLAGRVRVTSALLEAARAYESAVGGIIHSQGKLTIRSRSGRSAPAMMATENVAAELMEASNKPVATVAIVEEMRRRGIDLPGNNTNNVISARLSNSPRFKGRRGLGYWFADRPWPDDDGFDGLLNQEFAADEE